MSLISFLESAGENAAQTVTVRGVAPDQTTKEKIVLCCGDVAAVSKVDELLTVATPSEPASTCREVKAGDMLSKIAKDACGDADAHMKIFDTNKPMLADPDKITRADASHLRQERRLEKPSFAHARKRASRASLRSH